MKDMFFVNLCYNKYDARKFLKEQNFFRQLKQQKRELKKTSFKVVTKFLSYYYYY